MNVAELFAKLWVDVDRPSFELAERQFDALQAHAKKVTDRIAKNDDHIYGIINGLQDQNRKSEEEREATAKKTLAAQEAAKKGAYSWANVTKHAVGIAVGAFAIYKGATGIRSMVNATADQASAADEMAQKLGLSAEAVQEFAYAAKTNGTDVNAVASGMTKLTLAAKNAVAGNDKAAKAFKQVGLNAKDVASGNLSLDQSLMQIADRIAAMEDGPEKLALSIALLGKGGGTLIPMLNQGADGLARLRKEAADSGYVISNAASTALADFGDETDKLKMQIDGLRNQAIVAILPMLKDLVAELQAFFKANRAEIVASLATAMQALLIVARAVLLVFRGVTAVIGFFAEHTMLAHALLLLLIKALLGTALAASSAWISILGPLVLVGLAIAGLIIYFDEIAAAVLWAFEMIGRAIGVVGRNVMRVLRGIRNAAVAVGDAFKAMARAIGDAFDAVLGWIEDKINWILDKVDWIGDKLSKLKGYFDWVPGIGPDENTSLAPAYQQMMSKPSLSGAASVTIGATTIQVNAPNADGAAVADQVEQRLSSFWDRQLRTAGANAGLA